MSEMVESEGSGSGRAATRRGGGHTASRRWAERIVEAKSASLPFAESQVIFDGPLWGAHLHRVAVKKAKRGP